MANVILIRPISQSWGGEKYYRSLSIPHGPLTLAGHLIDKGYSTSIINNINKKFTGDNAVITKDDLTPLEALLY